MLGWLPRAAGLTRSRWGCWPRRCRAMLSMMWSRPRGGRRSGRMGSCRRMSWCISRWPWRCSRRTTMGRSRRGWPARWARGVLGCPVGGADLGRDHAGAGAAGFEPVRDIFARVAAPVADQLTPGAFLGAWRLMSIDGFEWDAPDTPGNAAAFGYSGAGQDRSAFPKVRVVTVSECGSHAVVDAEIGGIAGKGSGEQSLGPGGQGGQRSACPVRVTVRLSARR